LTEEDHSVDDGSCKASITNELFISLYCGFFVLCFAAGCYCCFWFFLIIHLSGLQLCSTTLFSIAEETGNKTVLAMLILDDVAS
jgi:hypothetical protein